MAPFRDDLSAAHLPADPLERFVELHEALDVGRGWLGDRVPLRYTAITMLTTPGEPVALAESIRQVDEAMRKRLGWLSDVTASVRLILAAQLIKYGDTADGFLDEVERVRDLFRRVRLRRGGVYEVLGVLVMRRLLGGQPVQAEHMLRFKAIYDELKKDHWLLTGVDDYPACAMLVGQSGTPQEIGRGVEAVYQALRRDANLWSGEALQTAANVLYLSRLSPPEVAQRFVEISSGLRQAGYKVAQRDYDEVAVLCFLATPAQKLVNTVMEYMAQIRDALDSVNKPMGMSLATSLAFVRLLGGHEQLGPLADAKLLLDMQAIVAARQAAATAAAS